MKKGLAFVALLCILLTGCVGNNGDLLPTDATTTTEAKSTTAQSTEATTPTTMPDEQSSSTITVYLLEKEEYCDSGKMTVKYDENYNVVSAESWTIENDLRYTVYYEQQDANGMPCKIRNVWPDGMGESVTVSYFDDGKIDAYQYDEMNFSGYQCAYDPAGNMTEKRGYYDGILESIVICEYDGETLVGVHCEDAEGNVIYDTKVENGLITERYDYSMEYSYGYRYEYDANGNLTAAYFVEDGIENISSLYTYKAVEVPFARAYCLMEQQKLLTSII